MLTQAEIDRHINTLRFAGLTMDQAKALDALVEALAEAQGSTVTVEHHPMKQDE